ncbi:MAG: protoporphyrinogen oxidase [Planctomycetaceae bacterium]
MRVAIIGGGIAGLSAAFYLRRLCPTAEVELFEAADRLGGAIQTQTMDGYLVEHGADMFATQPAAALELCRDLGIDSELLTPLPSARGAAIVQGGKLVRIPEGFVLMRPTRLWPMVRTPLLSLRGKLRILAEPWIPRRGDEIADESIESFVTRRLGRETLDRIVQPLVGGIYTGDVAKLSMAATMSAIWEMEQQDGSLYRATRRRTRAGSDATEKTSEGARYENFRSFPGGMARLIDALAATLDPQRTHLSTNVQQVVSRDNGWQVQTNPPQDHGVFDHVIVATPARIATKLLAQQAPEASRVLGEITAASSAVVVLGIRETDIESIMPIAGFIVPIRERRNILAASFTGDKFAGRTPPGRKLLRVFIGGELQKSLLQRSDAELVDLAMDELRQLIGLRGQPELSLVVRWNDAMPQYHVGHLQRLDILQKSLAAMPGLSVIGNSLHGVGIAPTIAYAKKVARSIAG